MTIICNFHISSSDNIIGLHSQKICLVRKIHTLFYTEIFIRAIPICLLVDIARNLLHYYYYYNSSSTRNIAEKHVIACKLLIRILMDTLNKNIGE